jgi:hypothetical protein
MVVFTHARPPAPAAVTHAVPRVGCGLRPFSWTRAENSEAVIFASGRRISRGRKIGRNGYGSFCKAAN